MLIRVEGDAGGLPAAAGTRWAGVATARCRSVHWIAAEMAASQPLKATDGDLLAACIFCPFKTGRCSHASAIPLLSHHISGMSGGCCIIWFIFSTCRVCKSFDRVRVLSCQPLFLVLQIVSAKMDNTHLALE